MSRLEPGRIQAVDLGRKFRISTGGGRSLKASLLRRESSSIHEFWALRHVDLDIKPGETFGVIGRNGSGKSTFLKMLARIYGPSEGACEVGGRMSSLLELGAGFHPEFNAIENVYLAGAVYGIPKKEIARDLEEIIGFAELDKFAYQPIKTYSSGMFMRLGFSVAMHVRPDVLLLDEVLAVGDERFIQKCLARIAQFRRDGGTMLLVTHDPATVERLCERAMLLEQGSMVMIGNAHEVMTEYHHRLASQANAADHAEPHYRSTPDFDVSLRILDNTGHAHHEFEQGAPVRFSIDVTPHIDLPDATLHLVLLDELGRELGGRSLRHVSLLKKRSGTFIFNTVGTTLRNGLFQVDVAISDGSSGTKLVEEKAIETLSIYGDSSDSSGPISIDGSWTEEI